MMIPKRLLCLCVFSLLVITLPACSSSSSGNGKVAIAGTVSVNGEPLDTGLITFIPVGKGVAAGGKIVEGLYQIESSAGLFPGEYKVEIDSKKPTGKKVPETIGTGMIDEYASVIPENYNRKTELKVQIQPADNKHDFTLVTGK
ncbi:hypothetical protein [uncultured Gimesia sp.]|jgi:hypothetical protein|uniref:hypothetical protein n=1 Tax=uncultured Gimesia sp. TaxID=1678688 RepID=UPI00260FCA4B|nr:hypothetical protein [uncultured Gimesia sp.]